ncbi:MAG: 50S ribosomal protein L25 [bacterium]|nr:50S ribosomal protein L25 [bacterium]
MELSVQKREIFGKKVKSLRGQGLIPAELYGRDFENIHLSVPAKDFLAVFKKAGESTIIKLVLSGAEGLKGGNEFNVLINDFQKSPLTNEISHVDFYSVRMDEKITAMVPLEFINESPAVKEKVGILIKAMKEIEVESLPADLPHHIEVDIGNLSDIGMSIRVKDLKINKGAKLLVDQETVVATVAEMAKEEEVVAPVSVEEVKVEGEEKREEKREEKKKEEK